MLIISLPRIRGKFVEFIYRNSRFIQNLSKLLSHIFPLAPLLHLLPPESYARDVGDVPFLWIFSRFFVKSKTIETAHLWRTWLAVLERTHHNRARGRRTNRRGTSRIGARPLTVREIEIRVNSLVHASTSLPKKRLSGRGNGAAPFRRISGMRVSMVLCLSSPPLHSLRAACEVKTGAGGGGRGVDSTPRNGRVTRVEVEVKREMATTRAHRPIAPVIVRRRFFRSYAAPWHRDFTEIRSVSSIGWRPPQKARGAARFLRD